MSNTQNVIPDATRTRILSYLATVGSVTDPRGYANRALRDALEFSGSAGAFTQMLASLDQIGLLNRDVQGRRTYSISLASGASAVKPEADGVTLSRGRLSRAATKTSVNPRGLALPRGAAVGNSNRADPNSLKTETPDLGDTHSATLNSESSNSVTLNSVASNSGDSEFDYDELALSLLRSVARIVSDAPQTITTRPALNAASDATSPKDRTSQGEASGGASAALASGPSSSSALGSSAHGSSAQGSSAMQRKVLSMERTVASLERDLARAKAERNEIASKNAELTEKLAAAEHNVELMRSRLENNRPRGIGSRLDKDDAMVLRQLTQNRSAPSRTNSPGPVPGWPRQS